MNTIETLFSWFVAASVRGTLLALATLLLQVALRKRLPAAWRYRLWLPVVLVLAAPWLPSSSLSIESWLSPAPAHAMQTPANLLPALATGEVFEPVSPAPGVRPETRPDWRSIGAVAWLSGLTLILFGSVVAYLSTMRCIRAAKIAVAPAVERLLAEAADHCGMTRPPRLLISAAVKSPALSGFLQPILLLQGDFPGHLSTPEARLVLEHELTHLRRLDLAFNWLLCLLQAIHWCNPVIWFVFSRIRADRESACDALVLTRSREDCRADYGHALLKLENTASQSALSLGSVGIFENTRSIRARIREIATYRKSHPAWAAVSVILITLLLAVGASRGQQRVSSPPPNVGSPTAVPSAAELEAARQRVLGKLNRIIFPRLEFREVTVAEALEFLERKSRERDTSEPDAEKRGVKFVLLQPVSGHVAEARLTVSLANVPLVEAVKYVTSLSDSKYRVRPDRVEVAGSWPDAEELLVRQFSVIPALLSEKGLKPTDDVKAFFTLLGVKFPQGATAAFASEDRIIVKAKEEDLDLIATWLAQLAPSQAGSDETKPSPSPAAEPKANADAVTSIERKLSEIVIPKLEFRGASIREAADFLRRKSVELDKAEPDPAKRGISIVLKPARRITIAGADAAPAPNPAPPAIPPVPAIPGLESVPAAPRAAVDPFDARITLSLVNIPFGEALRYVASLGNMQYRVDPHAVVLSPAPPPGELITKEYKTSPAFADMITRAKGVNELLTANAITFPAGASATYIAFTQRIVMRNTQENHNRLAELIRQKTPTP